MNYIFKYKLTSTDHSLVAIVTIAILAVLSGADEFVALGITAIS